MGAVAERLCGGVAAAAEEDRVCSEMSYAVPSASMTRDGALDEVGAVVGGCDLDVGHRFFVLRRGSGARPAGGGAGALLVVVAGQCPGGGPGGPRISNPFRLAIGASRAMSGWAFGRRRQHAFGGGLADLALESLELHRREADQRPRSTGLRVEGVRHALGAERERAGLQRQLRVRDPEGELALEDVEPLVLLGMDVPRRADARRARGSRPGRMRPSVSSRPILIVCSIPSSQNASPSSSCSAYPVCARSGEMVVICSLPFPGG